MKYLEEGDGWIIVFSLKGFDEEVALQFMRTLKDGVVVVKGLTIEFSEEVVAKVTRLPQEGKNKEKYFDLRRARAQLNIHQDPPLNNDKKQGTSRLSLLIEFIQLSMFIIH